MLTTTAATAGGLDGSGQGIGIIFEEGNAVELSFGQITPSVTGIASGLNLGGVGSGNMASPYTQVGLGFKYQVKDNLSLSLISHLVLALIMAMRTLVITRPQQAARQLLKSAVQQSQPLPVTASTQTSLCMVACATKL